MAFIQGLSSFEEIRCGVFIVCDYIRGLRYWNWSDRVFVCEHCASVGL